MNFKVLRPKRFHLWELTLHYYLLVVCKILWLVRLVKSSFYSQTVHFLETRRISFQLFKSRCEQCHVVDSLATKTGPTLNGLIGRKSGTVQGFDYSAANRSKVHGGRRGLVVHEKCWRADPRSVKITLIGSASYQHIKILAVSISERSVDARDTVRVPGRPEEVHSRHEDDLRRTQESQRTRWPHQVWIYSHSTTRHFPKFLCDKPFKSILAPPNDVLWITKTNWSAFTKVICRICRFLEEESKKPATKWAHDYEITQCAMWGFWRPPSSTSSNHLPSPLLCSRLEIDIRGWSNKGLSRGLLILLCYGSREIAKNLAKTRWFCVSFFRI